VELGIKSTKALMQFTEKTIRQFVVNPSNWSILHKALFYNAWCALKVRAHVRKNSAAPF
jgi:hypothetical protein